MRSRPSPLLPSPPSVAVAGLTERCAASWRAIPPITTLKAKAPPPPPQLAGRVWEEQGAAVGARLGHDLLRPVQKGAVGAAAHACCWPSPLCAHSERRAPVGPCMLVCVCACFKGAMGPFAGELSAKCAPAMGAFAGELLAVKCMRTHDGPDCGQTVGELRACNGPVCGACPPAVCIGNMHSRAGARRGLLQLHLQAADAARADDHDD